MSSLELLADQLFSAKPAKPSEAYFDAQDGAHQYVYSHVYSAVRGYLHGGSGRLVRYCDLDLSESVAHQHELGPYEKQLLGALLHAPHPVVIVTGSAGSGKSSTLNSILDFYDRHGRIRRPSLALGIHPKTVRVDVNKLANEYERREAAAKGEGMAFLCDKIPNRIPKAILASVAGIAKRRNLKPMHIMLELVAEAYRWCSNEEEPPDEFDCPQLLEVGPLRLTGDADADYRTLVSHVAHLHPYDRLCFWLGILDALALKSRDTGKRTLFLLDNVDPLPREAQIELHQLLLGVCQKVHFKIVVPLRLSTFRVYRQTVAFNIYSHSGPSPVDVVCHRLFGFVCAPETYPAFRGLDAQWKANAVLRATDILLRLTRGTETFRAIGHLLFAGAGDSVRRGLIAARALFESAELSFRYGDAHQALPALAEMRRDIMVLNCTGRLGHAIKEELVGAVVEHDAGSVRREQVDAWSGRIADVVLAVLERSPMGARDWSLAAADSLWQREDVRALCREDLTLARRLFLARLEDLGIGTEERERCLSTVIARALEQIHSRLVAVDHPQRAVEALLQSVTTWLTQGDDTWLDTEQGRVEVPEFPAIWEGTAVGAGLLRTNRPHTFAHCLLRRALLDNLFVEGSTVSTLPLSVLYFLATRPDGQAETAELVDYLQARDCSESRALALLNRLCRHTGRLLWFDHSFRYDSYDVVRELAATRTPVAMTHAGWSYYLSVLGQFDYLLVMLGSRVAVSNRQDLLSTRLRHALLHLAALEEDGCAQAASVAEPCFEGVLATDILVRCTAGMLRACTGHFARIRDDHSIKLSSRERTAELQETRNAVVDWQSMLRVALESGRLDRGPEPLLLGCARRRLVTVARVGSWVERGPQATLALRTRRVIAELEEVLGGEWLWRPGLVEDGYRVG